MIFWKRKLVAEMTSKIGVDAGGTLIKIAYKHEVNSEIRFEKFPADQIQKAGSWILENFNNPSVCLTGGKAFILEKLLNHTVQNLIEFEATCLGSDYLIKAEGKDLGANYILTNVGTGTSIHHVKNEKFTRVGGIGIGGGTLIGLSYLLTGIKNYDEIVGLSMDGDRSVIDLQVKDIYAGVTPPIPGDLTASNFGKGSIDLANVKKSDAIASVTGMIAETITTISCQAAENSKTEFVVYIGSTFSSHSLVKQITMDYTKLRGKTAIFLDTGEFSGAIGALLSLNKN
jgi:type II pantothenate kinase